MEDELIIKQLYADRKDSYDKGFSKGYNKGHSRGYSRGYSEGWNAGIAHAEDGIEIRFQEEMSISMVEEYLSKNLHKPSFKYELKNMLHSVGFFKYRTCCEACESRKKLLKRKKG